MSDFAKTFLRDRLGNGDERPQEYFGIFGKHPGWDDHIEDLPLPTASMVTAKHLLYVQGIGSQISSGAWARLSKEASLPDFNHTLLWVRENQFLVGRLWASRDGKRRAHFPMIALVHGINLPLEPALGPLLTQLEKVAAGCRAAKTSDEVRSLISRVSIHSPALSDASESNTAPPSDTPSAPDASAPSDTSAQSETSALPNTAPKENPITLSVARSTVSHLTRDLRGNLPPRCRLPADPAAPIRSLRFWSRLSTGIANPDLPLLFLAPTGAPWIDLLAREPAPAQFYCLRAALPASPETYPAAPQDPIEELNACEFLKPTQGEKEKSKRSWFGRILGN